MRDRYPARDGEHLYPLDALRGAAALIVAFFVHSMLVFRADDLALSLSFLSNPLSMYLIENGVMAVDLFFCISGFVFFYVYFDRIAEKRIGFGEFAFRRFSRLLPLYWATLGVMAVAVIGGNIAYPGAETGLFRTSNLYTFLQSIFLVQGFYSNDIAMSAFNRPAWSLTFELAAYAIFFLIVSLGGRKKGRQLLAVPILLGLLAVEYGWQNLPLLNETGERVLVCFFLGCFLCMLHQRLAGTPAARRLGWASLTLSVLLMALHYLSYVGIIDGDRLFGRPLQVMQLLCIPSVIYAALNVPALSRLLSVKPLRWLGSLSYSVYLWHFPVGIAIFVMKRFIHLPDTALYAVYIGSVLLVSHLSYHCFELPVQKRLRNRYAGIRRAQTVEAPAKDA